MRQVKFRSHLPKWEIEGSLSYLNIKIKSFFFFFLPRASIFGSGAGTIWEGHSGGLTHFFLFFISIYTLLFFFIYLLIYLFIYLYICWEGGGGVLLYVSDLANRPPTSNRIIF